MKRLIREIKKTVVFLGRPGSDGQVRFDATGFLLRVENVFHMATARHVVVDQQTGNLLDEDLIAFLNLRDGAIGSRSIRAFKDQAQVQWVFHPQKDVDVAMIPFGVNRDTDDVKTVPQEIFLGPEELLELSEVFFLSYQPGILPRRTIAPVFRSGTISTLNEDGTFYVDGSAFPGNSGSPVFLKPSPISFEEEGFSIGTNTQGGKFVGIIGEYVPYQEVAVSLQTGRPRVMFEENTGLSRVWSVKFIQEIIESPPFKEQVNRLVPKPCQQQEAVSPSAGAPPEQGPVRE